MKIFLILILLLSFSSCFNNITDKKNKIVEFDEKYFDELNEKYLEGNGYFDLKHGVIELDNIIVLNDLDLYKGDQLFVHIGYSIWIKNSIEILTKLKDLEINMISINIRPDFNNKEQNVDYLDLKREEAILFSEFKTKNRNLSLTMGRTGGGEFICSNEIASILRVKKEECGIIQIRENK